jgi:hypothetical protein
MAFVGKLALVVLAAAAVLAAAYGACVCARPRRSLSSMCAHGRRGAHVR